MSAHHFPCFSKLFNLRHLLEKFYELYVSVIVIWILFNLQTERTSRRVLVKGTVHQRTGHEGPDGKQTYSSTISLTSGLDRGQWSTPHPSCFSLRKHPKPILQEPGWAPRPVLTGAENLAPTWIQFPDSPACSKSLY